jgi:hypothetical protein
MVLNYKGLPYSLYIFCWRTLMENMNMFSRKYAKAVEVIVKLPD